MGKSTISMATFHCYVKLPEGITGGPHIVGNMIPIVFFPRPRLTIARRLQVISLSEQNDLLRLLKARKIAMKAWNNDMMYIHTDIVICLYKYYVYTNMIYIYIMYV